MTNARASGLALLIGAPLLCIYSGRGWAWQTTLGSDGSAARAIAFDQDGDVLAAGNSDPLTFTVVKLSADTGAVLWQQEIGEQPSRADDLAVDSAGNVIAAGHLDGDLCVGKFSGTAGVELWRQVITDFSIFHVDAAVAIDAQDDIVAAGAKTDAIVKLSGSDGSELWRVVAAGSVGTVAIDDNGDVIAGSTDGEVLKLSGVDGTELWRWEVDGNVTAVTVDDNGDVIGHTGSLSVRVFKLSGVDGTLLWGDCCTQSISRSRIAIDQSGDIFITDVNPSPSSVRLRKLSGMDGAQLWQHQFVGIYVPDPDGLLEGIALDPVGDPVAVGQILNYPVTGYDWLVASLQGSDGTVLWRRDLDGPRADDASLSSETARAAVVNSAGQVFVAGSFNRSGYPNVLTGFFTVMRLTGTLAAQSLDVRDRGSDSRRLSLRSTDRGIAAPPVGSSGDPTLHGALLTLSNPTTGETGSIPLPASNWSGLGEVPGVLGYRYRDSAQTLGPCKKVDVRNGKHLKFRCTGTGTPFSLDEPGGQGSLAVTMKMGTDLLPHCMLFGGTVKRDTPSAGPTGNGTFKARKAPEPVACPEVGSPSAAFLESAVDLFD